MAETWRADGPLETVKVAVAAEDSAERLAVAAITRWQAGETANAAALLREHPQLRQHKSLVLDLALEEFCQRRGVGEELDLEVFARRFPTYQSSLRRLLQVQSYLDKHSSLLPELTIDWPQPGSEFLGFVLQEELGRGAFARVYLATEPRLANRLVAVKVSPRGMEEAERLAKLRHPNIVPVYRVEQDPQTQFTAVCMPYLGRATLCDVLDLAFAGPDLPTMAEPILSAAGIGGDAAIQTDAADAWLRSGTYIDAALHLGEQLAAALHYTHRSGIYHLDLKPSNVLLTPAGRPMLLDFNLSIDRGVAATRIGGTLPYMSPEQIRASLLGDSHAEVDQRSDVFSLGVILYELLSNDLPFGSLPWQPVLHAAGEHLLEQQRLGPQSLVAGNPHVDPQLACVIERCLSFEADARPQTAGELAIQLQAQLGRLPRSRRFVRRHRRLAYTSLLLAAGLSGAAAGYAYSLDPYWVRMYRQGLAYSERAEYDKAIEAFTISLDANPSQYESLVARAWARERTGKYLPAQEDYRDAAHICPSGHLTAKRAYCMGQAGVDATAISLYETAINQGVKNAVLLTNLARCYLNCNELGRARTTIDKAIHLRPEYGIALHCRACVELRGERSQASLQSGLDDIMHAIRVGPESGQLYENAARLCALMATKDSTYVLRGLEYLEQAHARGLNVREVLRDPDFSALLNHAGFRRLLEAPQKASNRYATNWFWDPVPE